MSFVGKDKVGRAPRNHPRQQGDGPRDDVDDRATPDDLFAELHASHAFTVDVAASARNAKLPRYYARADDGLSKSWRGERVWCNPPYSEIRPWVEKALREVWRGGCERVVMLLPNNRSEQSWWQDLVEPVRDRGLGVTTVNVRARREFEGPTGGGVPPFGLVVVTVEKVGEEMPEEVAPLLDEGMLARPFLKMAGGKRKLAPEILKHAPLRFGAYHEPFLGGGAVFFAVRMGHKFERAHLSDALAPIADAWRAVKECSHDVIALLRGMQNDAGFYERVRRRNFSTGVLARDVADFIYCNRVCFNGVVRFNRAGQFNVPFGKYANPLICDEVNLRRVAATLKDATVSCDDFEVARLRAERGDFVFFDPPYIPASESSDFVGYTGQGFGMAEQERLRDLAFTLKRRGVTVVLSNADVPAARALYRGDFKVRSVSAARAINSDGAKRGAVRELIIY